MNNNRFFDFFPSKIAIGDAFCNRKNEIDHLITNINKGRHSVIYSPRRYGKSSLVNKIVDSMGTPFAMIDLFLAHDDRMITQRIMVGISDIISQLLDVSEKLLNKVQNIFRNFRVTLGVKGYFIEGNFSKNTADNVDVIYEALKNLDNIAQEKSSKIIIFFDEFQDIINSESSRSIQGAIRNIAQYTSNIVFIFSGSYQHMLTELFDDKTKPLYMLCDKLYLERIHARDYKKHINKIAQLKWGKELDVILLDRILQLSEAHAFYVNMLCNVIFENIGLPTLEDINTAWNECQDMESRRIISELQNLSSNQQDILRLIAVHNPIEPTGSAFSTIAEKAPSTIRQTIGVLLKKDFIYQVNHEDPDLPHIQKDQYRVLDPLIATTLKKLS